METLHHDNIPLENISGMQCSAVINSSYFVIVREGVKSAHTIDSAPIQDVSVFITLKLS